MSSTTNLSANPEAGSGKIQDTLNNQLIKLDQLLADPNFDHSRILEQALKVIMLMSRLLGNMEKTYVLDNESEVYGKVKELKGTYNTWTVLLITIASGTLTAGGGLVKAGSAIPKFAAWTDTLKNFGDATSATGQGTGAFSSLANNTNEAKRAVCQVMLEEVKRKRNDRDDAAKQKRNELESASNLSRDAIRQFHDAAQQILGRT